MNHIVYIDVRAMKFLQYGLSAEKSSGSVLNISSESHEALSLTCSLLDKLKMKKKSRSKQDTEKRKVMFYLYEKSGKVKS
jgi:hypothetical protein